MNTLDINNYLDKHLLQLARFEHIEVNTLAIYLTKCLFFACTILECLAEPILYVKGKTTIERFTNTTFADNGEVGVNIYFVGKPLQIYSEV